MKQKSFLNNGFFRILAPILYGVVIYIFVLLIFDSINQLYDNFFTGQVLLCIVLTYLVLEFTRLVIKLLDIVYPDTFDLGFRIAIQTISTAFVAIFITSMVISAYFKHLVGISNYNTELMVFNTIYLITTVLYNMLYFSIFYLNRLNKVKLAHEYKLKESIKNELNTYKNKINPNFLFNSFENIISLSRSDIDKADEYLNRLSRLYRYILTHKKNELISVKNEMVSVHEFVELINYNYQNQVSLKTNLSKTVNTKNIIPGSVLTCIENIVKTTIISPLSPLVIQIMDKGDLLHIHHRKLNRVKPIKDKHDEMDNLQRAYSYFKQKGIKIEANDAEKKYSIPFIQKEEQSQQP